MAEKDKVINLLKEEEKLIKHETIETKHIYKKLLEIEEMLRERSLRKFNDVAEWRQNVWENCKYKKEEVTKDEIFFLCTKTNNPCHFVDCPENLIE